MCLAGTLLMACKKELDDYYNTPEWSDRQMLDIINENPEFSIYSGYLKSLKLDTLFARNQPYTLFIPVNQAFEDDSLSESEILRVMTYSISNSVILPSQIKDYKKIQTLSGKFSIMERNAELIMRDGIELSHQNPLYKDGTFYKLNTVLKPRPSLLEYIRDSCLVLYDYIRSKDSVAFDPILSTPVGFDESGKTIYDSVFVSLNTFERDYFPVSSEFRSKTATLLLCNQDQYNDALNRMADALGTLFTDYRDIPEDWQYDVLLPYIFNYGTFIGSMDYEEFTLPKIQNIRGDSLRIDYTKIAEDSRYVCSNGITFMYDQFDIPANLYIDSLIMEGEKLAVASGSQFVWSENVITNNSLFKPEVLSSTEASGGKYVTVPMPRGYATKYYIEFYFPKVFPNVYNFTWRANYRPSGFINVYVNDVKVGSIDNYSFRNPVDGNKPTTSGFNQKVWKNITVEEYGDLRIRFEYAMAGSGTTNGINIDFVSLLPVK